jgi:hypothetical protein
MQYPDEEKLDATVSKVADELSKNPNAHGWWNVSSHLKVRPEIKDELAWELARANLSKEAERIAAAMDDNFVEFMLKLEDGEDRLDKMDMDYIDPFELDDVQNAAEELVQQYGIEYFEGM